MNDELKVLSSCLQSREAWARVQGLLTKGDLSEKGTMIFGAIGDYYERDSEATACDAEIVTRAVTRSLPAEKHRQLFTSVMEQVASSGASPENVVSDFIATKREATGQSLSVKLASSSDSDECALLAEEYLSLCRAEELEEGAQEAEVAPSLRATLESAYDPSNLIQLEPPALNRRLGGGLLRGHHLIAFARPEMGKTMMCVNWIDGFLTQGLKVLYCGNEDPMEDVILRIASRMTQQSKHEVLDDLDGTDEAMRANGYNGLVVFPMSPGSPREIEEEVRSHKPDVVIVDQLRNLNMREDNFTMQLDKAARAIRVIGKRHKALMISITQAGDSARNKDILDDGDIDYSNTGVPGACDVLLGLGGAAATVEDGRRIMSLPKNKPGDNHDNFPVIVDTTISRIRSN